MKRQTRFVASVSTSVLLLAVAAVADTRRPDDRAQSLSPGEVDRVDQPESESASVCPTFSWSPAGSGRGTELAVYELDETPVEGTKSTRLLAIRRTFPAGASSFTPSRPHCLTPGAGYAWFVRAAAAAGEAAGRWSEARRFTVPAAPSDEELAAALDVLRRWQGTRSDGTDDRTGDDRGAGTHAAGSVQPKAVTVAGTAAIRGEMPNASGEAYGVVGLANSAAGAGVAARNNANGPDLRLDGSTASAPDVDLNEAGIDKSSAADVTFDVRNPGSGAMTLRVDGVEVVTTETDVDTTYQPGNQLSLTGDTFDVVEGAGSGLDADLLDGQEAGEAGTINSVNNPVDWTRLKGVPADLADGEDANTPLGVFIRRTEFPVSAPGYNGASAYCPEGAVATGGGIGSSAANGAAYALQSGPIDADSSFETMTDDEVPTGWWARFYNGSSAFPSITAWVYVICAYP